MQIDAHQHFWNPARGDYGWMDPSNATLYRPYGPDDLRPHLARHGIDKTVLVQAAPTVEESAYMLGLADATPFVAGVVGWIDFENPDDEAVLARFAKHPKFVGVSPMIQDIEDDNWMLRADIAWAYKDIAKHDLCFDALGFPRHLANFHTILTRHSEMRCVIDHCMKPQIHAHSAETFQVWADGMAALARDTKAYLKFSALVTEANEGWTVEDLRPYADHVFACFGAERIMWGSDWPVCRLRAEYDAWRHAAEELTHTLTAEERARVFGGTAAEAYRLAL